MANVFNTLNKLYLIHKTKTHIHNLNMNILDLTKVPIHLDDSKLNNRKAKSVNISKNSTLHNQLVIMYKELRLKLGAECGDPFGCDVTNPSFHVELITLPPKRNLTINPLTDIELGIKTFNFNKYNSTNIDLTSKNNWGCSGRGFGLMIDPNGKSGAAKKEIHATLGFFAQGCDVNKCHNIIKNIIGNQWH